MPYVASTMAATVNYAEYVPVGRDHSGARQIKRLIEIKGGSGVASQQHALANGILTPQGVVTNVTDDELEFLQADSLFQQHLKSDHVKVMKFNARPEKASSDMNKADPSRPLTPEDCAPGGRLEGAVVKNKVK